MVKILQGMVLIAISYSLHLPKNLELTIKGVSFTMVPIPAGSFIMGSPKGEGPSYRPETQHLVTITRPFYLGETEVTQELYQAVVGANPSKFKGPKRPVESLSWEMAKEFCEQLSQELGRRFRLPSESEWEYACRAGTRSPFYFGNHLDPGMANFTVYVNGYPQTNGSLKRETVEVKRYKPNAWGLFDMHGNVSEWCGDWFYDDLWGDKVDPHGPEWGLLKIYRGGSWCNSSDNCRSSARERLDPEKDDPSIGFRLALPIP